MLARPPTSNRRARSANAVRVDASRARGVAGRTKISCEVDAESIQRLLAAEGLLQPEELIDYDLATAAERRAARVLWGRGVGRLLDLLCELDLDDKLHDLLGKLREMHFTRDS
jgi:hypothetical protein